VVNTTSVGIETVIKLMLIPRSRFLKKNTHTHTHTHTSSSLSGSPEILCIFWYSNRVHKPTLQTTTLSQKKTNDTFPFYCCNIHFNFIFFITSVFQEVLFLNFPNQSPVCTFPLPMRVTRLFYRNLLDYESNQQDATTQVILLFLVSSTCFGRCFRPPSGALDCIYSTW